MNRIIRRIGRGAKRHYFLRTFYRDVYRHRGSLASLVALGRYLFGRIRGNGWSYKRSRERLKVSSTDIDEILENAYNFPGFGPYWHISPIQDRHSLRQLANEVKDIQPTGVLEIGSAHGGSLFVWANYLNADTIVSLDLHNVYNITKSKLFWEYRPDDSIHLVHANSHAKKTLAQVASIFNDDQLDFLFIDGDHSYDGAKNDFDHYSKLVADGGIVAFDDISKLSTGVPQLWDEIEDSYDTAKIADSAGRDDIGLVYF